MKDLVTVLFVLVLGAGVAGGFFWWKGDQAKAADLAYERAIDEAMDRGIEAFELTPLLTTLSEHPGDDVELLRTLYADPIKSDRLNLTFGNFQGDWPTTYAHLTESTSRPSDRRRFAAEIDERFGDGAHALMRREYEAFLNEANANPTPPGSREEYSRGERQWIFSGYLHRNGRYPIAPIRIENGQVVEVIASDTPTEAAP
jgi:hypothetical protein